MHAWALTVRRGFFAVISFGRFIFTFNHIVLSNHNTALISKCEINSELRSLLFAAEQVTGNGLSGVNPCSCTCVRVMVCNDRVAAAVWDGRLVFMKVSCWKPTAVG